MTSDTTDARVGVSTILFTNTISNNMFLVVVWLSYNISFYIFIVSPNFKLIPPTRKRKNIRNEHELFFNFIFLYIFCYQRKITR